MSDKAPAPNSNRTWGRAEDLAAARGCDPANDCWVECIVAARNQIVAGELDNRDRSMIRDERHRRYAA